MLLAASYLQYASTDKPDLDLQSSGSNNPLHFSKVTVGGGASTIALKFLICCSQVAPFDASIEAPSQTRFEKSPLPIKTDFALEQRRLLGVEPPQYNPSLPKSYLLFSFAISELQLLLVMSPSSSQENGHLNVAEALGTKVIAIARTAAGSVPWSRTPLVVIVVGCTAQEEREKKRGGG